jgi:hypothetical protein
MKRASLRDLGGVTILKPFPFKAESNPLRVLAAALTIEPDFAENMPTSSKGRLDIHWGY